MDAAITKWINAAAGHHPAIDASMAAVAAYGVPLMIAAVALQWFMTGDRARLRHALIASGLSFCAGLALNQFILLFIHRIRPYDVQVSNLIVEKSADWSFPSDHATATAAVAATFFWLAYRSRALAFGLLAAVICWSRIYIGIHYLGDILGGIATGVFAAWLVARFYRPDLKLNQTLVRIF